MNRDSPANRNTQEWMMDETERRQAATETGKKLPSHTKIEEHFICVGGWSTFNL